MSFFQHLKASAASEWRDYIHHPFTDAMADGSLPQAAFRHYLVQDYLFLIEFARAYALAVYKSHDLADMRDAAAGMSAILDVEMKLHVTLCASWGLTPAELEQSQAAPETLAYTRYVLDTGMRGDLLALHVALAPCIIGYAEVGKRLAAIASEPANPYSVWIDEYAGSAYQDLASKASARLENLHARYATPARDMELVRIFRDATRLETSFWEMGWRASQVQ
ncbi:thiaminase II [Roseiarcaceae bacterium H3SJ34-1]|uniref:thiaminase II n=1 Tax=Terripilifer ovatus TaxID=3032367 RepID=UPI003AB9A3CE|nr:thiaminase II [Roseiarcaceae bacterium H3SJ34-1]